MLLEKGNKVKGKIGISIIVTGLLFISGCSSTSNTSKKVVREDVKIAMEEAGYRCERTVTVGSNIKKKRCSTKKMRDAQREAAIKSMERGQGGGATTNSDGI